MSGVAMISEEAGRTLAELYGRLRESGCGAPAQSRGQLIRPVLSLAGATALGVERTPAFWSAVAAVQLAHEASLVHDDVIDEAAVRRAEPTLYAQKGVAAALVEGDHLLTTAYRLAAASGSHQFTAVFAHAVERTVAGEKLQGGAAGLQLEESAYRRIVALKSGELLGCALAVAPLVAGAPCASDWYVLGRRIGTLYQMLDDLLDYCPGSETGKPALVDYRQRRWTWPLLHAPAMAFDMPADDVARRFAAPDEAGSSPLRRCLAGFADEAQRVRAALAAAMPADAIVAELIDMWVVRATAAVEAVEAAARNAAARALIEERLARVPSADAYFRVNSRSFSFAARAFPPRFREQIAELYAFCRFTDDLADTDGGLATDDRLALLDTWEHIARTSYHGTPTGMTVVDGAMASAAAAGVPFSCVEELVEGMRMDLRGATYDTPHHLRIYSYRVAGVIGEWITRMSGVHEPAALEAAARLGHAMQLTNILRDVGDDLRAGRLYLPLSTMRRHGLETEALRGAMDGGPLPAGYAGMLEDLMAVADRDYVAALEAVHALPGSVRRAVVVAAHVYRGIHDRIRANGYDNLRRRARTGALTKALLALRALAAAGTLTAGVRRDDAALHPTATPAGEALRREAGTTRRGTLRRARGATTALLLALLTAASAGASAAPAVSAARPANGAAFTAGHDVGADTVTTAVHLARLAAESATAPHDTAIAIDLLRALYFAAVDDSRLVGRGHAHVDALRDGQPALADERQALLTAYRGAFTMLEAKHGSWPPSRLRAVREGLRHLDAAVALVPDDIEVRYLRLVSTHYLPGLFGRRESARADLRAVAELLPAAQDVLPPELYHVVAVFVHEQATR